jgi:spore maturation protein CgeB
MKDHRRRIVICGLSISSSWGNGHATTYRALVQELVRRGHDVLFLERDRPCYATNRDLPSPPFGRFALYSSLEELQDRFGPELRDADMVIVGSFVPDGIALGRWITRHAQGIRAFYDIDTPVTLSALASGSCTYLAPSLVPAYDLYLSFTGGPILRRIEAELGSPAARALYCSVDAESYYPELHPPRWNLGYLGTYSDDRQPALIQLLVNPATVLSGTGSPRFVVAGSQYPTGIEWGKHIDRIEHLAPDHHREFYNSLRFTLNITRRDMIEAGYSPSVRLFEAGACGTPIISDSWQGLDSFFELGTEILVARSKEDVLQILTFMPEEARLEVGARGRRRVLEHHTAATRALELESAIFDTEDRITRTRRGRPACPPIEKTASLAK